MAAADHNADFRCGQVALLGRPNVGKSTLLNRLIGFRLSIVSQRPQTTRHRIVGISTSDQGQILYVDTPGLHHDSKRAMNRSLNRAARGALAAVDVAVQLIEAGRWTEEDESVYKAIAERGVPCLLCVNKVDRAPDKRSLLPFVDNITREHHVDEVFYLSATQDDVFTALEQSIRQRLPVGEPMYEADEITDRGERFLVAEMIREQLMRRLGQELPYATTVMIESFEERDDGVTEIHAVIWVERQGQKAIVIGRGGEQLKTIGASARQVIERTLERRLYLRLWVKVRDRWGNDESALQRFGYTD